MGDVRVGIVADTLALGTAQLDDYVISAPSERKAQRIIETAWDAGIRYYDTAQAYGLSEARLSIYLPAEAKVITKLHPDALDESLAKIEKRLWQSFRRFEPWAVLLHREQMLERWHEGLGDLLCNCKSRGLIQHIGLSVESSASDPYMMLPFPDLDVVQVPANIERMPPPGVNVFVRSVFERGEVQNRRAAIHRARERFPDATLVIGAETSEQVRNNCRMVEQVYV